MRIAVMLLVFGATRTGLAQSDSKLIEDAMPRIADRGAALFYLAKSYAHSGNLRKALTTLEECVALREGFDPGDDPAFQALREQDDFHRLVRRARAQSPVVHRARVAYTIAESDLFPEGLAHDAKRHVFYMGSMHRRKIIAVTDAATVFDFVKPGRFDLKPVGGIKVDPIDHTVWAATDGPEFVHFDTTGELIARFATTDEGPHILNDLVLDRTGSIYLTDSRANRVYRFDRRSHAFTSLVLHRPVRLPNGITLSGDGQTLYIADLLGVITVNLRTGGQRDVDPGRGNTLAGIDGLYWYHGGLVGVQYGTRVRRIIRAGLSTDGLRVTSFETLEQRTPLVSFPTTGAVVDDNFYYIANTGIGNLDNDAIVDSSKLEPVHIAMLRLDSTSRRPRAAADQRAALGSIAMNSIGAADKLTPLWRCAGTQLTSPALWSSIRILPVASESRRCALVNQTTTRGVTSCIGMRSWGAIRMRNARTDSFSSSRDIAGPLAPCCCAASAAPMITSATAYLDAFITPSVIDSSLWKPTSAAYMLKRTSGQ